MTSCEGQKLVEALEKQERCPSGTLRRCSLSLGLGISANSVARLSCCKASIPGSFLGVGTPGRNVSSHDQRIARRASDLSVRPSPRDRLCFFPAVEHSSCHLTLEEVSRIRSDNRGCQKPAAWILDSARTRETPVNPVGFPNRRRPLPCLLCPSRPRYTPVSMFRAYASSISSRFWYFTKIA